jgi:hypothetical protein
MVMTTVPVGGAGPSVWVASDVVLRVVVGGGVLAPEPVGSAVLGGATDWSPASIAACVEGAEGGLGAVKVEAWETADSTWLTGCWVAAESSDADAALWLAARKFGSSVAA